MNPPPTSPTPTSTSSSRARRSASQILLLMALVGSLAGFHHNAGINMQYLHSILEGGSVSSRHFSTRMSLSNQTSVKMNSNNNSVAVDPCPSSTSVPPITTITSPKQAYPNRTDVVWYAPARGRRDRSGAAIGDMLKAQAYCYHHGVAFGGACGDTPHQATNEAMIAAVGLDPILKYACPPTTTTKDGVNHEMIARDQFLYIPPQELFTDEWLDYIHTQVQPKSKEWNDSMNIDNSNNNNNTSLSKSSNSNSDNNNNNYTIAVHVRRGDVDPCGHWSFRYLPNSHYIGMIDHYKRQAPRDRPVHCQVFSESHSLIESFDDFYEHGCEVILDGDPTIAWKTMLTAHVVILSLSSFSNIPALLNSNPNKVVAHTPLLGEPLQASWKRHIYKHSNHGWRYWINLCDDHYNNKKG